MREEDFEIQDDFDFDIDAPRENLVIAGKKQYVRRSGYPTDHLIRRMSDRQLLDHMGVPDRCHSWAIKMSGQTMPDPVEYWFAHLPYIYRPMHDKNDEKPELYAKGLVLHGPSGNQKTTVAAAILLRVVRMKIRNSDPTGNNRTWHGQCMGKFTEWQDLSELLRLAAGGDETAGIRATEEKTLMTPRGDMLKRGDFLVIDDISRERGTEFNLNELQRILRHRENEGYPTILTTNHDPKTWRDEYDDVMSAFLDRAFIKVPFV